MVFTASSLLSLWVVSTPIRLYSIAFSQIGFQHMKLLSASLHLAIVILSIHDTSSYFKVCTLQDFVSQKLCLFLLPQSSDLEMWPSWEKMEEVGLESEVKDQQNNT